MQDHSDDIRLGQVAIARGWLDQQRAHRCLEEARRRGTTIIEAARLLRALSDSNLERWIQVAQLSPLSGSDARRGPRLPNSGDFVGPYQVVRLLGRGGMGVVYEVEQHSARFALKLLLTGADIESTLRFEREAQATAAVDRHPNVVKIHSFQRTSYGPAIVMDLVEGGSLADRVGERLSLEDLLSLAKQVCSALEHVHSHGIVHRDLKPDNILIRARDGAPLVTDFGLAKAHDAKTITATGEVLGTPLYMAPEQILGAESDQRLDLWALGVILYMLATGERPFKGETLVAISQQIVSVQPEALSSLRPDLPAGISSIVHRCLEKEPQDRYQSAAELFDDIERFERGEVIAERRVARWLWGLVAVALVAGLGVLFCPRLDQPARELSASALARFDREIPERSERLVRAFFERPLITPKKRDQWRAQARSLASRLAAQSGASLTPERRFQFCLYLALLKKSDARFQSRDRQSIEDFVGALEKSKGQAGQARRELRRLRAVAGLARLSNVALCALAERQAWVDEFLEASEALMGDSALKAFLRACCDALILRGVKDSKGRASDLVKLKARRGQIASDWFQLHSQLRALWKQRPKSLEACAAFQVRVRVFLDELQDPDIALYERVQELLRTRQFKEAFLLYHEHLIARDSSLQLPDDFPYLSLYAPVGVTTTQQAQRQLSLGRLGIMSNLVRKEVLREYFEKSDFKTSQDREGLHARFWRYYASDKPPIPPVDSRLLVTLVSLRRALALLTKCVDSGVFRGTMLGQVYYQRAVARYELALAECYKKDRQRWESLSVMRIDEMAERLGRDLDRARAHCVVQPNDLEDLLIRVSRRGASAKTLRRLLPMSLRAQLSKQATTAQWTDRLIESGLPEGLRGVRERVRELREGAGGAADWNEAKTFEVIYRACVFWRITKIFHERTRSPILDLGKPLFVRPPVRAIELYLEAGDGSVRVAKQLIKVFDEFLLLGSLRPIVDYCQATVPLQRVEFEPCRRRVILALARLGQMKRMLPLLALELRRTRTYITDEGQISRNCRLMRDAVALTLGHFRAQRQPGRARRFFSHAGRDRVGTRPLKPALVKRLVAVREALFTYNYEALTVYLWALRVGKQWPEARLEVARLLAQPLCLGPARGELEDEGQAKGLVSVCQELILVVRAMDGVAAGRRSRETLLAGLKGKIPPQLYERCENACEKALGAD